MTSKTKIILSNILIIFGFVCLVCGIVMIIVQAHIMATISAFLSALVFLVIGFFLWNVSGHPVAEEPKVNKVNKPKKSRMSKKYKRPFMTEKEWEEEEEEEEENMYIE